ncbi:hypothetical protein [Bacillus sp. X1(2014)]|uniref:hypothetical protein n=1 Tax=Bacillus sp. X1(2014) TaxID=1565991 RepID=UPI001C930F19|nr:hypothetical protein [Bacillus sp. X1(2014)]
MRKKKGVIHLPGPGRPKVQKGFHEDELCYELRNFIGREVTIRTESGDTFQGELRKVTASGIVEIVETFILSPFSEEQLTFVRCRDIESFSVILSEELEESSSD